MNEVYESFFEETIAIMRKEISWASSMNFPQIVRGSNFEMGYQQGKMNAERIRCWLNFICADELVGGIKRLKWPIRIASPILRPTLKLYWTHYLKRYMPETLERIRGMAEGSGCSVGEIFVQQLIEIVGAFPMHTSGCSSVWLSSGCFEGNEPILAKNFDYLPFLRKFQIIRESYPLKGYASLELSETSLAGSHSGLNERGLVIIYHYAYARDKIQHGLPMSMFVQHFLQTCSSVEEVLEKMERIPWLASGILIIGDTKDNFAVVELSHSHMAKRRAKGSRASVANHYEHPEMAKHAMAPEARFPKFLPPPWKGTRIRENSEARLHDMKTFLEKLERASLQDVKGIMADHGSSQIGSNNTVCRHSKISSTICSAIFFPSSLRLLYCHGAPCSGTYEEYQMSSV